MQHNSHDKVIDAFDVPKLSYSVDLKQFMSVRGTPLLLSKDASMKAELFRERFNVLRQRTLRHKLFTRKLEGCVVSALHTRAPVRDVGTNTLDESN